MGKIMHLLWWCIIGVSAILWHFSVKKHFLNNSSNTWRCWKDFEENTFHCIPVCSNGSFSLPGMKVCHPWLSCDAHVSVKETIVQSVVKTIHVAEWNGHDVILSTLSSPIYENDFNQNLNLLITLGPNPFTVQLLGYCNNTIITQYHKLGSALNFNYYIKHSLNQYNKVSFRLKSCISYAAILNYLHTSPVGVRVMCDSNTLEKTLSQYLLTDDLQLVVNDLDATPRVDNVLQSGIICGPRPLNGTFVAPEQLWPYNDKDFDVNQMPLYDEKTDIWKLPDVCNWLLGNAADADIVKFKLFSLHKRCKDKTPSKRPNVNTIIDVYKEVMNQLFNENLDI